MRICRRVGSVVIEEVEREADLVEGIDSDGMEEEEISEKIRASKPAAVSSSWTGGAATMGQG